MNMKTVLLIISILITILLVKHQVEIDKAYRKRIQRINDVYNFRLYVINLVYSTSRILFSKNKFEEAFEVESLTNRWDYMGMVNSDRPLTLEEWYTKDEIKLMKGENL